MKTYNRFRFYQRLFMGVSLTGMLFSQNSSSIIGPQGLVLTPTANFPADGEVRFGYRSIPGNSAFVKGSLGAEKNHLFYGSLVYLPRLELTGLVTLAPGYRGNDGTNTYKDLALFAQIHVLKETKYFPALAMGIYDFYSYSYYNALFLVTGKQIPVKKNFVINTSLGYGVDWIKEHLGDTGPDRDAPVPHYLIGFFGGLELRYGDLANLSIEYDTNRINAGFKFSLLNRIDLLFTTLRMDTFSFGINYRFSLLLSG